VRRTIANPDVRPTKVATPLFFGRRFFRKAHIRTDPKLKRIPPAALKTGKVVS
jgi:hypothetical protein